MKLQKKVTKGKENLVVKREKKLKRKVKYKISIRTQIITGFLVPILLIILLGTKVYDTAKEGLIENYKQGAVQTLQVSSDLLDTELNHIEQTVFDLYLNDEINYYSSGVYYEETDNKFVLMVREIQDNLSMKMVDPAIANVYIIPQSDTNSISTIKSSGTVTNDGDIYSEIKEDLEAIKYSEISRFGWLGSHDSMDEIWEQDNSEYILSCFAKLKNDAGILSVDVKSSYINEIIENIELPEGGSISFITFDGREINSGDEKIKGFASEQFYIDAVASNNVEGNSMVEFQGETYLFMYHVCNTNGSIVAELVPESEIMKNAYEIRSYVNFVVIFAAIIVGIIGTLIMVGLERKIGRLQRPLRKMATGDLTVQVEGEGKTAFGKLNRDMDETIFGVKKLINKVKNVAAQVSDGVEEVEKATENISKSSLDINSAIDEISQGTMQQANDSSDCLIKMDELSKRILSTSSNVDEVTKIADNTIERIQLGSEHMDQLIQKSNETGRISEEVGEKVAALADHSIQIESFISQIEEIADETNLLSLNASIEAARAGDAGRGFAVVANEIQKLSDNSLVASQKIAEVVKTILKMTNEAKDSTNKAIVSIEEQQTSVYETGENFKEMNTAVLSLLEKLRDVTREIENMQTEREETLAGIENISSVTEETAAVSENVEMNANNQIELTEKLQGITNELKESTEVLMKEISLFIV